MFTNPFGRLRKIRSQKSEVRSQNGYRNQFEALKQEHAWRELRTVSGRQGAHISIAAKRYVNFGSNDYLGLSQHPALLRAAQDATGRWGTGAQASRLVSGNLELHEQLERATAEWKQSEACLVYPSGYSANVGLLSALFGKGDVIMLDKHCHASLVDGARLSGATIRVFPHQDLGYLKKLLKQTQTARQRAVVTEGIFSMAGDVPDLPAIIEIMKMRNVERGTRNADMFLMVDDAHATGVLGALGRGSREYHFPTLHASRFTLHDGIEIIWTGTYSKALGSQGGFVCGSRALRDFLINSSRSFIYSTGLAPACAGAALAALELLMRGEAPLSKLRQVIATVTGDVQRQSPIVPIHMGSNDAVLAAQARFMDLGYLVPAMRYPTVRRGEEMLRVALCAQQVGLPESIFGLLRIKHE